jgi:hypothetical protein
VRGVREEGTGCESQDLPGRRDHSMIAMTAAASTTKMVSVRSTAVGSWGAMTKMLTAKAATMQSIGN